MSEIQNIENAAEAIVPQTYWYLSIGSIVGIGALLIIFVIMYFKIIKRIDSMETETDEIQLGLAQTQEKLAAAINVFTEKSGQILSVAAASPGQEPLAFPDTAAKGHVADKTALSSPKKSSKKED